MNCEACHLPVQSSDEYVMAPSAHGHHVPYHAGCRSAEAVIEPAPSLVPAGPGFGGPTWPPTSNPWQTPAAWRPQPIEAPSRGDGWVDVSFLAGGSGDDPDVVPNMSAARTPWNRSRPRW